MASPPRDDLVRPIYNAAMAHAQRGAHDQAIRVLTAGGNAALLHPATRNLLGNLYLMQGKTAEALRAFDAVVKRNPDFAEAHYNRSVVLHRLGRNDEALAAAERAIAVRRDYSLAHLNRARVLRDLGRPEDQLAALDVAERLGADKAEIDESRIDALFDLCRLDEADTVMDRLVQAGRDSPDLRYNRGLLLLYRGRFAEGWEAHEGRLERQSFGQRSIDRAAPRWQGEDLRGKSLLIYGEQGLGDAIHFARYLTRIPKDADGTLLVKKPLHRLLAPLTGGMAVSDAFDPEGGWDYQVSLVSLGRVFGTRLETIPGNVPYLVPEEPLVAKWRGRLAGPGFKVGVCWQGSAAYAVDRFRSMPAAALAPLAAVPGVRLISLQAINGLDQVKSLPRGMRIEMPGDEIAHPGDAGFAEMAGLMANLDLVVTVDTAAAHLAGALARPVWTAVRFQPEWRWLEGRSDSPWYPTMRLFRQGKIGEWAPVVDEMAAELQKVVVGA